MRTPTLTTCFKKDIKGQKKRGKSREKLKILMEQICRDGDPAAEHSPHNFLGNWAQYRECHIEPDWLLIYVVEEEVVRFYRTGTHSDLFN